MDSFAHVSIGKRERTTWRCSQLLMMESGFVLDHHRHPATRSARTDCKHDNIKPHIFTHTHTTTRISYTQ